MTEPKVLASLCWFGRVRLSSSPPSTPKQILFSFWFSWKCLAITRNFLGYGIVCNKMKKKMTCWPFFGTVTLLIYVRPRFEKTNYLMQTVAVFSKKLVCRARNTGSGQRQLALQTQTQPDAWFSGTSTKEEGYVSVLMWCSEKTGPVILSMPCLRGGTFVLLHTC